MEFNKNRMNHEIVKRIVYRCKNEGKRAFEIAEELKIAGYKVFTFFACICEGVVFFDTKKGLQIREII